MRASCWNGLMLCVTAGAVARADCPRAWIDQFPYDQFNDSIHASIVFDDGTGPALYVGGEFTDIGGTAASCVARWDGRRWSAVGEGLSRGAWLPRVNAFVVWETPLGPRLVAGGNFDTSGATYDLWNVAQWDGTDWRPIQSGVRSNQNPLGVTSLAVFDDGNGPTLYAGGDFQQLGYLVRLQGEFWLSFGAVNSRVHALHVMDDGDGPALFIAGDFTQAGTVTGSRIARWDGVTWSSMGAGIPLGSVRALASGFVAGENVLFVGGSFAQAGGIAVSRVAMWNGSAWSAVGAGISADFVYSLLAVPEDGNTVLYAGGDFTVGGVPENNIAKWTGQEWSSAGFLGGLNDGGVETLCLFEANGEPTVHAGGTFRSADGRPARHLARLEDDGWTNLGRDDGVARFVSALLTYDDGSGIELYAGGSLDHAGDQIVSSIARWDGLGWSAVGAVAEGGSVLGLGRAQVGGVSALVAGGNFSSIGGVTARNIAAWDGSQWLTLDDGLYGRVNALVEFDDGNGPALYVGGSFAQAGGVLANRVARWNGTAWSALGPGLSGTGATVEALCVYDDGNGPALYASGTFDNSGGFTMYGVVRWSGLEWNAVGGGVLGRVNAMTTYDSGDGTFLFVGGAFDSAGGTAAKNAACWTGTTWNPLGVGLGAQAHGEVYSIAAAPDGSGVYFGGRFIDAGGMPANNVARWDGQGWNALDAGLNGACSAITPAAGTLPAGMYFGGEFTSADGRSAGRVARWSQALAGDMDGSLVVDLADLARLLSHFGQGSEATFADGDLDGDTDVDIADLAILLSHFATTCS